MSFYKPDGSSGSQHSADVYLTRAYVQKTIARRLLPTKLSMALSLLALILAIAKYVTSGDILRPDDFGFFIIAAIASFVAFLTAFYLYDDLHKHFSIESHYGREDYGFADSAPRMVLKGLSVFFLAFAMVICVAITKNDSPMVPKIAAVVQMIAIGLAHLEVLICAKKYKDHEGALGSFAIVWTVFSGINFIVAFLYSIM